MDSRVSRPGFGQLCELGQVASVFFFYLQHGIMILILIGPTRGLNQSLSLSLWHITYLYRYMVTTINLQLMAAITTTNVMSRVGNH